MTQIEWARAVAEHPEGHSRADVERACSVLAEQLAKVERAAREHLTDPGPATTVEIVDGAPRYVFAPRPGPSTRERLADLVGVKLLPTWRERAVHALRLGSTRVPVGHGRPPHAPSLVAIVHDSVTARAAEHRAACHRLCERRGDVVLAVTSDACACVSEDGETARFLGETFLRGDP